MPLSFLSFPRLSAASLESPHRFRSCFVRFRGNSLGRIRPAYNEVKGRLVDGSISCVIVSDSETVCGMPIRNGSMLPCQAENVDRYLVASREYQCLTPFLPINGVRTICIIPLPVSMNILRRTRIHPGPLPVRHLDVKCRDFLVRGRWRLEFSHIASPAFRLIRGYTSSPHVARVEGELGRKSHGSAETKWIPV